MEQLHFLIDVNLPKYFRFFNQGNCRFVADIDLQASDNFIWEYALTNNNLVIVTKGTDFYNKFLMSENAPKIIFVRMGNVSLKHLYTYFEHHWETCKGAIQSARMVILYKDKLELIS